MDGFHSDTMIIAPDWAKNRWVYIYLFSKQSLHGFGTFVPGVGSEYFESSTSGSYNLSPYGGSHFFRLGTKNSDSEPLSNFRKFIIYKGSSLHSQADIGQIQQSNYF